MIRPTSRVAFVVLVVCGLAALAATALVRPSQAAAAGPPSVSGLVSPTHPVASDWYADSDPSAHDPHQAGVRVGGIARLAYFVEDPPPCAGWCNVEIVIKDLRGHVRLILHARRVLNDVTYQASFRCRLPKVTYCFRVYATDPAGNHSPVAADDLLVR